MNEATDPKEVKNSGNTSWLKIVSENLDNGDDDTIASSSETLVGDMPPVDSTRDRRPINLRRERTFDSSSHANFSMDSNFDERGTDSKSSVTNVTAKQEGVILDFPVTFNDSSLKEGYPTITTTFEISSDRKANIQNPHQGPSCRPKDRNKMKSILKKSYSNQETLEPPSSPDRRASYSNSFSFTAEDFYRSRMIGKSVSGKQHFTPDTKPIISEMSLKDSYSHLPEGNSQETQLFTSFDVNGRNATDPSNMKFKSKYNFDPEVRLPVSVSSLPPIPPSIKNALPSTFQEKSENQPADFPRYVQNYKPHISRLPGARMKMLAKQASAADADIFCGAPQVPQKKMVRQHTFDHSILNTSNEAIHCQDDKRWASENYYGSLKGQKYPSLDISEKNLDINDLAGDTGVESLPFHSSSDDFIESSDESNESSSDSEDSVDPPFLDLASYIKLDSDDTDDVEYLNDSSFYNPHAMTDTKSLSNYSSDHANSSITASALKFPILEDEENDSSSSSSSPSPCLLKPPEGVSLRRGSIVTCDTHNASLEPQPDPVKIVVLGDVGVGKTAVIVRLVTGRFIGDYDPSLEAIYSYDLPMGDSQHPLQIMDTAVQEREMGEGTLLKWADAVMVIFSITSEKSLQVAECILRWLLKMQEEEDKERGKEGTDEERKGSGGNNDNCGDCKSRNDNEKYGEQNSINVIGEEVHSVVSSNNREEHTKQELEKKDKDNGNFDAKTEEFCGTMDKVDHLLEKVSQDKISSSTNPPAYKKMCDFDERQSAPTLKISEDETQVSTNINEDNKRKNEDVNSEAFVDVATESNVSGDFLDKRNLESENEEPNIMDCSKLLGNSSEKIDLQTTVTQNLPVQTDNAINDLPTINVLKKPTFLLGNKADLDHRREVAHNKAELLAKRFGCCERETAASAPWEVVSKPFVEIYHQVLERRKLRQNQEIRYLHLKI